MNAYEIITIGKECCRNVLISYNVKKDSFGIECNNNHTSKIYRRINFYSKDDDVIIYTTSFLQEREIINEVFIGASFHPGVEFFIGMVCVCNIIKSYSTLLRNEKIIVTAKDINKILSYYNVKPSFYHIGMSPDKVEDDYPCVDTTNAKDGIWEYYFYQKGIKDNLKRFNNESNALIALIGFFLYNNKSI